MSDTPSDLAGARYWDAIWRTTSHQSVGRFGYFRRAFARLLESHVPPGSRVCEVGCANSVWVPFLARRGAEVTGLDYSEPGLSSLRRTLAADNLTATLIQADLLSERPFGDGTFDFIFSLGLVEHFTDPREPLAAMVAALRPGGRLLTSIPNLVGIWGPLLARVDRRVYDLHVPCDAAGLDAMHASIGLVPVEPARYFEPFGLLLLHRPSLAERAPRLNFALTAAQWLTQQAVSWPLALAFGRRADTRTFSSSILGIYTARQS